ncbi:hypothetical protein D3C84_244730 [compost metagenome]
MSRCCIFHFTESALGVAAVKLVVATHVDHWALEDLVSPLHATRFDINVAGENDYIRVG